MAAAADTAKEQDATPKMDLAQSASTFPQSFPIIDRNFSNASSVFTEVSLADMTAEQQEALSVDMRGLIPTAVQQTTEKLANSNAFQQNLITKSQSDEASSPDNPREGSCAAFSHGSDTKPASGQVLQKLLDMKASGNLQASNLPDDTVSVLSVTAVDGSVCSNGIANCMEKPARIDKEASIEKHSLPNGKAGMEEHSSTSTMTAGSSKVNGEEANSVSKVLANGKAGGERESSAEQQQATEAKNGAEKAKACDGKKRTLGEFTLTTPRGEMESRASGSSLSPSSEPFVPSTTSSQQVTPRKHQNQSLATAVRLNANAAAFVPTHGGKCSPANGHPAGAAAPIWPPKQLQFGSLPESLNTSPHLSTHDQQEWQMYESAGPNSYVPSTDNACYSEQDWHAGWEGEIDQYGAYANGDGSHYVQQSDGTWVAYWDNYDSWQAHGENGYGATYDVSGNGYYENGHMAGRPRRGGKFSRRGGDRRRMPQEARSWNSAVIDVLESQFKYSRESLQEMLELHEGNLEIALDMLAQLEAEMDGQLPECGQDAPELNEENFPSLSTPRGTESAPKISKGKGFADAVKTTPSTPPKQTHITANGHCEEAAAPTTPAQHPEQISWKETGASVSESYAQARAVAKDHARLRNAYFQEATKAYMAGDGALAKELGAKGREQSDLMKAAHVEASQTIYKHRNPTSTGRAKGKAPGMIDLHGLHVKEAVTVLESEIANVRRCKPRHGKPTTCRLSVLVGAGKHTKGSKTPARLPAAIEDFLTASQIPFAHSVPGLLELAL